MQTIYKYQPHLEDRIDIESFDGAILLDVQIQNMTSAQHKGLQALTFWFLVDTDRSPYTFKFAVFGTGNPVDVEFQDMFHVATVQQLGGALVWHIFELCEE